MHAKNDALQNRAVFADSDKYLNTPRDNKNNSIIKLLRSDIPAIKKMNNNNENGENKNDSENL